MNTNYVRRAIVEALDATKPEYAQVIGLVTDDTPLEFREIPRLWFETVVSDCLSGKILSFDAFPDLALTAATPESDPRWIPYRYIMKQLGELPILTANEENAGPVAALQLITDENETYLAVNKAVQGRFWVWIDGRPYMEVGMEAVDRINCTHITVLFGQVRQSLAAMVFWKTTPSIVRSATPERLRHMLDQSIGVLGARRRWQAIRQEVDPAEIRSALFEADRRGVHPAATGSAIVDILEASVRTGLPSRKTPIELTDLSPATVIAADDGEDLAERWATEEILHQIYESAPEDERKLLDAMRASPGLSNSELGHANGWAVADVVATFRRLRRRARKTAQRP